MKIFRLLRKFYGIFCDPVENPVAPLRRGEQPDVEFTVWNKFTSTEELTGLRNLGMSVHWFGNHYPPRKGSLEKRTFFWGPFFLLVSAYFLKLGQYGIHWSMRLFDWLGGQHRPRGKMTFVYVDGGYRTARRARRAGIPVLMNHPIAHMDRYLALEEDFKRANADFPIRFVRPWVARCNKAYREADWHLVGSRQVKQSLVEKGIPADRVLVVNYGVEASRWAWSHEHRAAGNGDGPLVFIYCGTISSRKGMPYLLRAWKSCNFQNAELRIFGSGVMDWDAVCGGLPENVKLMGRVKHDVLAQNYAEAVAFVQPSLMEGFVRSGAEALCAGLPGIVTEESGLTDAVTDGVEGWVVPSRDEAAIAERLKWCVDHPAEVRAAGEAAFQRMKDCTFESYGETVAKICQAIIRGEDPRVYSLDYVSGEAR